MDDHTETLIELNSKLTQLLSGIDALTKNQERMCEDISKIKEAVYNPDQGIYARLRELENWKSSSSKVIWMLVASIVGLSTAALWAQIVAGG